MEPTQSPVELNSQNEDNTAYSTKQSDSADKVPDISQCYYAIFTTQPDPNRLNFYEANP